MSRLRSWEAEFLVALRNRTGRYFYGRDMIEDQAEFFAATRYGRVALGRTPTGSVATGLSIAAEREIALRASRPELPGRIRRRRRVLHLDPLTVPLYDIGPKDTVLCHDLGPITHPELFGPGVEDMYRAAYTQIAAHNPALVFVSRASRDAYVSLYGETDRMHVIYPPVRVELMDAAADHSDQIKPPFFLTVGSIGSRKNQKTSIEGFVRSGLAEKGWTYVLCGPAEPGAEDVVDLAERTPNVVLRSYVPDSTLVWLYQNAGGFVLASHLEGFGIPVAEAIQAGLVPVVSRDSVLEEVAGEGALPVDPHDPGSIAAAMNRVAVMDVDEKTRRSQALDASIARFDRETFRKNWREVLESPPGSAKPVSD